MSALSASNQRMYKYLKASVKNKKRNGEATPVQASPLEKKSLALSIPSVGENNPLVDSSVNLNQKKDSENYISTLDTRPCFKPWRLKVIVMKATNLLASDGIDVRSGRFSASSDPMVSRVSQHANFWNHTLRLNELHNTPLLSKLTDYSYFMGRCLLSLMVALPGQRCGIILSTPSGLTGEKK